MTLGIEGHPTPPPKDNSEFYFLLCLHHFTSFTTSFLLPRFCLTGQLCRPDKTCGTLIKPKREEMLIAG